MNKTRFRAIGPALAVLMAIPTYLQANSLSITRFDPRARITEGSLTLAPMGHVVFCVKHPEQCALTEAGDWFPALSAENMEVLERVNESVNRSITPKPDRYSNGMRDHWKLAPSAGDCEDFAVTKRAALIEQGFPAHALRLAVARTSWGEGHAVLIVRTDKGDLVLDNRHSRIVTWNQTDLTWISIQSGTNPRYWHSI